MLSFFKSFLFLKIGNTVIIDERDKISPKVSIVAKYVSVRVCMCVCVCVWYTYHLHEHIVIVISYTYIKMYN